ncbi:hypothetical protein GCM10010359_11580 [Streptomyces morookaense]|nr:hypothetical protein GCM10010359_11580 [Streptomyces morookaense]
MANARHGGGAAGHRPPAPANAKALTRKSGQRLAEERAGGVGQPISSNALPFVSFTNFITKGMESTAKTA